MDNNRLLYLLRIAAEYIDRHGDDGTIVFDGTQCDGRCLIDDINAVLEGTEYSTDNCLGAVAVDS